MKWKINRRRPVNADVGQTADRTGELMGSYTLRITEDEALVLFEFFSRFDDTDKLQFEHTAEYLVLQRVSAQIDKTTSAMFSPDYESLLAAARARIAEGFDGDVPGMGSGS